MKNIARIGLILVCALWLSGTAQTAAETTLKGTLVCAQCGLKKADAHECQDVLVVNGPNGAKTEYYVTKNDVAKAAGEVCTLEVPATIVGEISEKDGKKWITPSKIDKK